MGYVISWQCDEDKPMSDENWAGFKNAVRELNEGCDDECTNWCKDHVNVRNRGSSISIGVGSEYDAARFFQDGTHGEDPDLGKLCWGTCKTNHVGTLEDAVRTAAVLYSEWAGGMKSLSCDYGALGMKKWMEVIDVVRDSPYLLPCYNMSNVAAKALITANINNKDDLYELDGASQGPNEMFCPDLEELKDWAGSYLLHVSTRSTPVVREVRRSSRLAR
jgi:hypothetical protein